MPDTDKTLQLIENPDYWVLSLEGAPVVRCIVGQTFTIELGWNEIIIDISLIGDFILMNGNEASHFSPEQVEGLGNALTLINKKVVTAKVYKSGLLEIEFDDTRRLVLEPDERYESWHITTSKGSKIICMPHGELAIWT